VARYEKELGRPAPEGFGRVRVHDLRHTFGRRLRAAGVSLEDRQDLPGAQERADHHPLQCDGNRGPSVALADIYLIIAHYLYHTAEIDSYLSAALADEPIQQELLSPTLPTRATKTSLRRTVGAFRSLANE
jgi:hypothetical protein